MGRQKNQIPERWEVYKPLGKRIPETRFICCKCPLKEEISRKLPSKSTWFTPQCLFRMFAEDNLKLGMLIDLTNTDRYYSKEAFTYAGVEHVKIYTPGHDEPGQESIDMFREAVQTFEKNHSNDDHLIAVHCTHGVNRTGYQLCRYLIESCGWTFEKAVQTFNLARGHPIERENYLTALQALETKLSDNCKKRSPHSVSLKDHKKKRRARRPSISSTSSTSSADSLFKPFIEKSVKENAVQSNVALGGVFPSAVCPVAPPITPMFNANVVQQVWANVAQMQAMLSRQMNSVPIVARPGFPANLLHSGATNNVPDSEINHSSSGTTASSTSDGETSDEEEGSAVKDGTEVALNEENQPHTSSAADWESGGKVDPKATKSVSQKRRERHRRVWKMHRTLQSGHFWKIREMQKEKYGF